MKRSSLMVCGLLPLVLAGCFGPSPRAPAPVVERAGSSPPAQRTQSQGKSSQSSGVQVTPLASPQSRPATAMPAESRAQETRAPESAAEVPPSPAYAQETAPSAPVPQQTSNTAVAGLLAQADEQHWAGDTTASAATVERALRIEPGNAYLWSRLAQLRFDLRQYTQAEDLAAKSNSLAGADRALRRDNWLLIARVRQATGDRDGARHAEQEAEALR